MELKPKIFCLGTPMIPLNQKIVHKRVPPIVLPLKYKIQLCKAKAPSCTNASHKYETHEESGKSEVSSPKLPIISIKRNRAITSSKILSKYAKDFQKFHNFKPLFHGRNKSYNIVPDEDQEYQEMKKTIRLMDY